MDGKFLNVGCGTHYVEGWVNVDVWEDDSTKPDVVVANNEPYPFESNYFDAVYLGHVLEHIKWDSLPQFMDEIVRISKPGANVLAVGPDVYKTIKRWKAGNEPWDMVTSVLEHQDITAYNFIRNKDSSDDWWEGALHMWNCHEERVREILSQHLEDVQIYSSLIEKDLPGNRLDWYDSATSIRWPIVGYWYWQCAVMGVVKK